jgi:hypothetical protein
MKDNARTRGFSDLYAPVRPTQKHLQPRLPMADYVRQIGPEGLPKDPWLRLHVRAGGRIIKVAPYAMTIVGSVADWTKWTGMQSIDIPHALVPVNIFLEHDFGVYVDPGVCVRSPPLIAGPGARAQIILHGSRHGKC